MNEFEKIIERFVTNVRKELDVRWAEWPHDVSQDVLYEVIGALVARQVTLASELAVAPSTWNGHVGPLFLRAMADVHITVAWILGDPLDRARKFVHFGLGQEKLQLEHRKAALEEREAADGEREALDAMEQWINSQRLVFLTNVELGSWSGISTRKMAEEAGCLDFYNYVYTPFSGCAHSMWQHVAKYNLKGCSNALHGLHSVPNMGPCDCDPHYLYLAGKYLQKTLSVVDEKCGCGADVESSFEVLCSDLQGISAETRDE